VQNSSDGSSEEGIVLRLKVVSAGRLNITIDGSASQEYDLVAAIWSNGKLKKCFSSTLRMPLRLKPSLTAGRYNPLANQAGQHTLSFARTASSRIDAACTSRIQSR
jgi:hypothetical protein